MDLFIDETELTLSDIVDIKLLQKFQDILAKIIGISCVIVDDKTNITNPSNFSDFCTEYIHNNQKKEKKCYECDIKWAKLAAKKNEPVIYNCELNITNFAIPIIINGKHFASILGGQVFSKEPDEKYYKEIAKHFGLQEDKIIKHLKKLPVMDMSKINMIVQLLSLVANFLSRKGLKNLELMKINERDKILKEIISSMRDTLNAEEIKKYFVEITMDYFAPDRCIFIDYDRETNTFLPIKTEKLKSKNIPSLLDVDTEIAFPEFCNKLRKGKDIILKNLEKVYSKNHFQNYKAIQTLKENMVKSDYGLFVKYRDIIIGILIIHFIKNSKILTPDEFQFLKVIRDHAGTALYQAELYSKIKQKADKETLLRKITETIRNSINIDETKKTIVDILGKTFKADRCFIMEYNKADDNFLIINEEYLSSEKIMTYKGVNLNENIPNLIKEFKNGKSLIFNEKKCQLGNESFDFNSPNHKLEKEAAETFQVHSALVFPIYHSNNLLGDLVLHYVEKQHDINKEEIEFLNLLVNQIALALHQAQLYKELELQAERERINRNIIEILRSTLDKDTIKHLFVKNIGKYFNADRVFFSEFDLNTKSYLPIDVHSEYLSTPEEKSFINCDLTKLPIDNHLQTLLEKRELYIPVWEKYIKNYPEEHELVSLYKEANVKSSYSFPVLYEDRTMGYFCIEYTHKICELLTEDINRIRSICTQAGIALYHAELYTKAQEALDVEEKFIEKVKNEIQEPVNNIIQSCNQLLKLTNTIIDDTNYNFHV